MSKRTYQRLSKEFKLEAIRLAVSPEKGAGSTFLSEKGNKKGTEKRDRIQFQNLNPVPLIASKNVSGSFIPGACISQPPGKWSISAQL